MSDKQWYVVYTRARVGEMNRYLIEHDLLPFDGFEDVKHWQKWQSEITAYFHERTAINEKVLAVEPADFITAYPYRKIES